MLLEVLKTRTADEWIQRFAAAGVPAAPVLNLAQVLDGPQLQHQEMVVDVEDGRGGTVQTLGNPFKTPDHEMPRIGRAPLLGEHGVQVLGEWLGVEAGEAHRTLAAANPREPRG